MEKMDKNGYQQILEEIYKEVQALGLKGKVADYIPELSKINPERFGICLVDLDGNSYGVGDYEEEFSIQSISKVFTLAMVFGRLKGELWQRVNVEPSGNPFNSLVQLEYELGIPRNPFINAGALVTTDALISLFFPQPEEAISEFIKALSNEGHLTVNQDVQNSELQFSDRNRALANFIKSYKNIENEINKLIEVYTYHCSIEMSCYQLAKSFMVFANNGYCPNSKRQILDSSSTKRLNALMLTCGFYDEAGEFAFKVGLPGKSGVGGGIAAVLPGKFSIAVWSPALNKKGNSMKGIKALELLTDKLGISLF
jgi:glutaminase